MRQLLDADKVQVVRATEILGLLEASEEDPVVSEIWQALRGHATLIDLLDEDQLPDELRRRIDAAQDRIWLWNPWVGRRSEQLLPHLSAAQHRGIRVHPVVLPRDQVNMHVKPRHEELAGRYRERAHRPQAPESAWVTTRMVPRLGSAGSGGCIPAARPVRR